MQAAQASNNAPARYDPVRLHRPTTPLPGHGCPNGLGVNLSVTTAVPATEMTSVAAVAPAKVVATLPTVLHHSLRRLADGSRPPTPEGSLAPFGWGSVVPRAPHLPVTRDARLGTRLLAEQQVLSSPSEEQHSFRDTLVSHANDRVQSSAALPEGSCRAISPCAEGIDLSWEPLRPPVNRNLSTLSLDFQVCLVYGYPATHGRLQQG